MKRFVAPVLLGGIAGLVVGYFVFGDIAGVRLDIRQLLPSAAGSGLGGAIRDAASDLAGIGEIRRNILLTGAGGAALGLIGSIFGKRR